MFKIDIFIPKSRPYAQQELRRKVLTSLGDDTRPFYVSSPEDIILNKLDWYKMGGCTSKRQWADISGVLHRQKQTLDFAYLRHWAINLRVADLLEQALIEMEQQEVRENLDSIIETVEILSDEDTMEALRRGIQDIEEGRIVPLEDVKKQLE
jgi:predicted transcriptional regulator